MLAQTEELRTWARGEFGHARLGDRRRVERLVEMAATAAHRPAGTVTAVFQDSAEREAAFRFLESEKIAVEEVARASHIATVKRCIGTGHVFVPVDGTSVLLTDRTHAKGFGRVGSRGESSRGLQIMSALAVAPDGKPLGVCEQLWWARDKPPMPAPRSRKGGHRARFRERETRYWIDALEQTNALFREHAPDVRPWFQIDRGGDCWPVLATAVEKSLLLTIRSNHNRRLESQCGKPRRYLWNSVETQPVLGRYTIDVPAQQGRRARIAHMTVRACSVCIELRVGKKRRQYVTVNAVLARETGNAKDRLEWKLLTTHPVTNFDQACAVIHGYKQRWRIEEFHRAWKSGVCDVEASQLRARDHFIKWATLLAAVASRAIRISYLARNQPELLASEEFTQDEIDAVLILKKRTGYQRGSVPKLGELVRWIADLGGYTGKSSGGPPGPTVIARGLQDIEVLAKALKNLREM